MDTYLKIGSVKKDKNCNCISPFYINNITGINPNTGRNYTDDERQAVRAAVMRMSNARGCQLGSCCDPRADYKNIDPQSIADAEGYF